MKNRSNIFISLVCLITGIMIAIQFQSTQEPTKRDTRDLWEIRTKLQTEQKKQQQLYQQILETEQTIEQYNAKSEEEQLSTLKDSIEALRRKAGLTNLTGSGLVITIHPIFEEMESVQTYPSVNPDLLNGLINELNTYGASNIAIEGERIISITPIRYVNGETYVNNRALPSLPIVIKVLTQNPSRLLDHIQVSKSRDYFVIENLDLQAEIKDSITLPKYEGSINLDPLDVKEPEETGGE